VKLDDVFKNAGDMQKMYRDWTTLGSQGRELSAEMRMVVRISRFSKFSALSLNP
jgi:hypothetical protein